MSIINATPLLGAGADGYQIERSLRFNSADSAYLVNSSTRTTTVGAYTFSFWVKRCALGGLETIWSSDDAAGASNEFVTGLFNTDNKFYWYHYTGSDADAAQSNGALRDTAAWYHIVFSKPASAVGTLYINGVAQTKQTSYTADADAFSNAKYIGSRYNGTRYSNCYLTEFYGIDGQALTPSSFGETDTITGVWKPKKYSGTYGTNGFYLKFADNSGTTSTTLGKDSSGNGNNWTPNNFSVTAGAGNDSLIDTPTPYADGGNGRGNYCTLNAVSPLASGTLSNGNLSFSTGNADAIAVGTVAVSSGKWYWEITATNVNASLAAIGIIGQPPASLTVDLRTPSNGYCYISNGNKGNNNTTAAYGATYTSGDVIGVALDLDAGTLVFYKNNSSQGTAYSSLSGTFSPAISDLSGASGGAVFDCNFGQRSFSYTPPSGFSALNTQNLPEPSIKKPSSYMGVVTYTGTGATQTISSFGFSPDFAWIKSRSTANSHRLFDSVRGATNTLISNTTSAEVNETDSLTAFNSNGFSLGADTVGGGVNVSTRSYVAWCWDESATPGFDIVTYTGNGTARTIAHSLGVAPNFIMVKDRDSGSNGGAVYHSSLGNTKYLKLFQTTTGTDGEAIDSTIWNNTSPTSSVFSVGTSSRTNANTDKYVAYLFSEVASFSKFGSYIGNGSSDGPFVFCGFRPRWVMIKRSDSTSGWHIYDTARSTYNVNTLPLAANLADQESSFTSGFDLDVLSNGFKARAATSIAINTSGGTYIFAAFAESPFKYSLAR